MIISIFEFLKDYYGKDIDPRVYLNHKTAKRKYHLKICSFGYASNHPELVKNGEIIYVRDTYGVIIPYLCPRKMRASKDDQTLTDSEELQRINALDDLDNMPTYLVRQLLSEYKYIPSFYKIIRRKLERRGVYDNKIYRLRKEILKNELEKGDYNDKYQRRQKIKCKKP